MKRVSLILAVAFLLIYSATAEAKPAYDYSPWKKAMFVWMDVYAARWTVEFHQRIANGTYTGNWASIESPPATSFNAYSRSWGEGARIFAQFISAIELGFPSGCLSPELGEVLSPYLGIDPRMHRRSLTNQMKLLVRYNWRK